MTLLNRLAQEVSLLSPRPCSRWDDVLRKEPERSLPVLRHNFAGLTAKLLGKADVRQVEPGWTTLHFRLPFNSWYVHWVQGDEGWPHWCGLLRKVFPQSLYREIEQWGTTFRLDFVEVDGWTLTFSLREIR